MKVIFKKKYKDSKGRIFVKGSEEGLTRDKALPLIKNGFCEPLIEYEPIGILDKEGNEILKQKEDGNSRNV